MKTSIPASDQIAEIMREFDFHKVHSVMKIRKWQWCDNGVPDVIKLRETAQRLLEQVAENKSIYNATGGFWARMDKWGLLSLQFVLASWDIDDPRLEQP